MAIGSFKLTNATTGAAATLESWSLNITPQVTVRSDHSTETTVNGIQLATEFAIDFPQQQVMAPTQSSLARTFSISMATVRTPRAARASMCSATRVRMARPRPCSTVRSIYRCRFPQGHEWHFRPEWAEHSVFRHHCAGQLHH